MESEELKKSAKDAVRLMFSEQKREKSNFIAVLENAIYLYLNSYEDKTRVEVIEMLIKDCGDIVSSEIWSLLSRKPGLIENSLQLTKKEAEDVSEIIKEYLERQEEEINLIIVEQENKKLNLYTLLENCIGSEFYMPHYGNVRLAYMDGDQNLTFYNGHIEIGVTKEGLSGGYSCGEVCVFPSKEQRDWSLFQPPWIPQKGERVWVSYEGTTEWYARYFNNKKEQVYYCFMQDNKTEESGFAWTKCVPFDQIPW